MRRIAAFRAAATRPPAGPSCSRWLSCSCCRHKARAAPPQPPPQPPPTQNFHDVPPDAVAARAAVPPLSALQRARPPSMPHLPLPPPLPWSPGSAPFLRHMQILGQALLSPSANESWEIFSALHEDLRPAIPDDVFVSLLVHQLERGKGKSFGRVLELLGVARVCALDTRAIPLPTLHATVAQLLRHAETGAAEHKAEAAAVIDWLWPQYLARNKRTLANTPLEVRQRWLEYRMATVHRDCVAVFASLEEVIEQGGGEGMSSICARILTMYNGKNIRHMRTSIRLAAWCLARDIEIRPQVFRTLLGRLAGAYRRKDEDARTGVCDIVNTLIQELEDGGAHGPADRLRGELHRHLADERSALQKAQDLVRSPSATVPRMYRAVERLLWAKTLEDRALGEERPLDEAILSVLVDMCLRAVKMDAEYEALVGLVTQRLGNAGVSPTYTIRLARSMLESGAISTISPQLVARIFNRVADAADADPRAFTIATELYPFVRASADPESSIRWLGHATGRWATLFRHAVTSGNMHFASRLYADFQADGETVPQASQLAFIRAIAQTQSSSRRVLLDRHIKDYLWDGAPTEPLVTALCLGLANSPDDAQFAVHLSASIRPNQPLAPEAIAALVPVLITSARENRRQLALSLLSQLPDGESARPALHAAALALRRNIAITGIEPLLRVYRLLATRGIESTGETASIFMVTLLKAYETKVALAIFESAIADNRADVHPAAVSSLMIRLAQTGRTAYAYNAEKQWRALLPTPRDADGVIFGARLFVDIKAGKPVNLAQYVVNKAVVPSEGWAPTRPFFRWLERAQHEQRGAEEGEWVSLLGPMRVAEVAENPEESLEKVVLGENTDLSDNAEPAEESESAEQATAAEEEDPRTVPRQTSTETQVHMCGSSLGTGTVSFA